jgi:hydroxypyruvate reductase
MTTLREDAQAILNEAIDAVLPEAAVERALARHDIQGEVVIVAIGKAAWRMAKAAVNVLADKVSGGIVITKYGHALGEIPGLIIMEAGHPVPDENGVHAAREAIRMVSGLKGTQTVVFLVSGGGSALFELPLDGVTLSDIADITKQLLGCGANIVEINTIRKHLSQVKGGRFALKCAPAHVLSIVLSDVLNDPLDSIASGPAYPDSSTVNDALNIVKRYKLKVPDSVLELITQETPKVLVNVTTEITGNVNELCRGAKLAAEARGYDTLLLTTTLDVEAKEAGGFLAAIARQIQKTAQPVKPPCAVIMGGETVVHLRGHGKGGRNQELALAAAKGIDGLESTLVLSVGSDGTDGPTDAAGGLVTGGFADTCREMGIDLEAHLNDNNSYHVLKAAGGLVVTGPTGTNVNDLMMVLCR